MRDKLRGVSAYLKRNVYVFALVAVVLAVDQATKFVVTESLVLGESWPREGFFRITRVANTGSAFGLFGGQTLALTVASVVGIVVIAWFFRSVGNSLLMRTSLGLMLSGAIGNLIDRIAHGYVTDFVDIGPWYIFNVADSAIVVGVIALLILSLRARETAAPEQTSEEAEPELDARLPAVPTHGDDD